MTIAFIPSIFNIIFIFHTIDLPYQKRKRNRLGELETKIVPLDLFFFFLRGTIRFVQIHKNIAFDFDFIF